MKKKNLLGLMAGFFFLTISTTSIYEINKRPDESYKVDILDKTYNEYLMVEVKKYNRIFNDELYDFTANISDTYGSQVMLFGVGNHSDDWLMIDHLAKYERSPAATAIPFPREYDCFKLLIERAGVEKNKK